MYRHAIRAIAAASAAAVLLACAPGPDSPQGFALPPGDGAAGRQAFIDLGCHRCHRINGVDLPQYLGTAPVAIVLGGASTRVRTYGELVTSIINPSHRLITGFPTEQVSREGESLMPVLNSVMTVQQLIDLVALLQSSYSVVPPADDAYAYRYDLQR
jgi:sulfur-oxidizing protein SoxX